MTEAFLFDVSISAVAYVTKTCSHSFRLLIRIVIYQIVHLDKLVPKMVVANFFPKVLKVNVKGQRSTQ